MSENYYEEDRRQEFYSEQNRLDDDRRTQFWADENAIEQTRLQEEHAVRNKRLLDEDNLTGFAVENDLPMPAPVSGAVISDESALADDYNSHKQKSALYLGQIEVIDLLKKTLLNEVLGLKFSIYSTSMEQSYLETIYNTIVCIQVQSEEEVNQLEISAKFWEMSFPKLSGALGMFTRACRLLHLLPKDY